MKELIGSIIDDCLSVKGVPMATAGAVLSRVMGKRHQVLREVIASEFRQGNFDHADEDEFVSICYRLIRDAEEGLAKNNLRLLARVINGMAEKNELKAPSFLRYATILSSLTDKEVRILAVMVQYKDYIHQPKTEDQRHAALQTVTKQAEGHLQALMRTGLVNMRMHTIQDISDGTHKYALTKLMDEILMYIKDIPDFEAADDN